MSQSTKRSVSVISVLLALVLGIFLMRFTLAESSSAGSEAPPLLMNGEVEVLLLRMGLDPDGLAAAGLSGTTVQGALSTEKSTLEDALTTLEGLDATYAAAKVSVDELRDLVKSGLATLEEVAQLKTAKAALAAATAARVSFMDDLAEDLLKNFSTTGAAVLRQIRANQRWDHLPIEYRVKARTEADWVTIRNAVASKRTQENKGNTVPSGVLTFLSNLNADTDVAAAKAETTANKASVQATWDSVFGG